MSKKTIVLLILLGLIISTGFYFYYFKPAQEEIKDPLLAKIKSRAKLIIGTDATYPPMESLDEKGEVVGLDIDIAKEIAKDLGVSAELRSIKWEELFSSLNLGEVDMVISSVTITLERAKTMAFSDPYFNAGQVIVVKKEKVAEIKEPEDLKDKKVGVQVETTSETEAKKYTEFVVGFENYEIAKEELLKGELEAIVIDYPAALGMVSREKTLLIVGEPFTQEFYGVVVRIGEKGLLGQINTTLRRLKEGGGLRALEEKWLGK